MGDKESNKKKHHRLHREESHAQSKQVASERLEPSAAVASNLPELTDDFNHALFKSVILGPRRELTLELSPLIWIGNRGYHNSVVTVHLGGIINFEQVKALFDRNYHKRSELAYLRYDRQQASKSGSIHLELEFERVEAGIAVQCSDLTVTDAEPITIAKTNQGRCPQERRW